MQVSLVLNGWGTRRLRNFHLKFSHINEVRVSQLSPDVVNMANVTSQLFPGSPCLGPPSTGITGLVPSSTRNLHGFWGSELSSLLFQSKHSVNWAIPSFLYLWASWLNLVFGAWTYSQTQPRFHKCSWYQPNDLAEITRRCFPELELTNTAAFS